MLEITLENTPMLENMCFPVTYRDARLCSVAGTDDLMAIAALCSLELARGVDTVTAEAPLGIGAAANPSLSKSSSLLISSNIVTWRFN